MTETQFAVASTPTATPFAALIGAKNPSLELATYRGALTPHKLDAPEIETEALVSGAGVHDLGWMRRVSVTGDDSFRWLNGMVSNTVNDLGSNAGAWNLVLNAQGRIQGDLWVWRDGNSLELEVAADQFDKLMAHLNRFIIMDDVELAPVEGETALGVIGPLANDVLAHAGLPALPGPLTQVRGEFNGVAILVRRSYGVLAQHYEIRVHSSGVEALWDALRSGGATPVGTSTLESFRIAEGIPAYGIDIEERDLAQETSQARALCFSKGCYLGQEIVERIHARGNVHRHLRHLELAGPLPQRGAGLFSQAGAADVPTTAGTAKPSGQITSAAELLRHNSKRVFALAMVRAEAEVREQVLHYAVGSETGTGRLLAGPPTLSSESTGSIRS